MALLFKILPYLIGIGSFIAGVVAIYMKGRRDSNKDTLLHGYKDKSSAEERARREKEARDAYRKQLEEELGTLPDNQRDDRISELLSQWTFDDR